MFCIQIFLTFILLNKKEIMDSVKATIFISHSQQIDLGIYLANEEIVRSVTNITFDEDTDWYFGKVQIQGKKLTVCSDDQTHWQYSKYLQ